MLGVMNKSLMKWMNRLMHRCFPRKLSDICWVLCLDLVFLLAGFSFASGNQEGLGKRSPENLADFDRSQRWGANSGLANLTIWYERHPFLVFDRAVSSPRTAPGFSLDRAGPALVGAIMALLATFEAANVLPPEGTAQANQLIHGLIQLQSALVKAQTSELSDYVSAAVNDRFEMESGAIVQSIPQRGLTSKLLEAILMYDKKRPIWDQSAIVFIFQNYNISRQDWQFIDRIFTQADAAYRAKGGAIHEAYEEWRSQMPGGRSRGDRD
jgi:hypothetical protein